MASEQKSSGKKKKSRIPSVSFRFPTAASRTAKTCPHCKHDFGPTDGLTVKRVPMGRKIESWIFPTTIWWSLVLVIGTLIFIAVYIPPPDAPLERGLGWFLVYAPMIPGGILAIISWFFPHVRIYHCRQCGKATELPLKDEKSTGNVTDDHEKNDSANESFL